MTARQRHRARGEALASVAVLGPALLGARLPRLLPPDRRGGARQGHRDHLRQPGRRPALGVAVLGEEVTARVVAGLLLILTGSWLSADGRLPPGLAAIAGRLKGRGALRSST